MKWLAILVLLAIAVYTLGFAVTLWKEKQRFGAMAVIFLTLSIMILPFFSILK
ncbi:hypothetical protein [Bacillus sp. FJAT-29814]|uniref:hypothetical protein n=1 Tax=Bacillus sp. FJAT-29814 TaxID=1729688 RepID=UPI000A90BD4C|nr:hypothetical protein [Bacillus sp. FJAT-29814]